MDRSEAHRAARRARLVCHVSRLQAAVAVFIVLAARAACAAPAGTSDATIFRVFLKNGTAVVSYGEYARVGERVIFLMPIGRLSDQPVLHLVNLPANIVDWTNTERYTESARYARYVASQGDADFAALSGDVAAALNSVTLTTDPVRRLQIAEEARRKLAEWPAAHYGYRASDVGQILAVLDEAISELRAAAGGTAFDLNLVASMAVPPAGTLIPDPTAAEALEQALTVAKLTDVPAERLSLLRSVAASLDADAGLLPMPWKTGTRIAVQDQIADEVAVETAYARLFRTMVQSATAHAQRADVRGVEKVLARIRRRDHRLGEKRPDQIAALLQEVQASLDSARRLRLARDQWTLRRSAYREYRGSVKIVVDTLNRIQAPLRDIKTLAGPAAPTLPGLSEATSRVARRLATIMAPDELKPVHALMVSAVQLADTAVRVRRDAIESGNLRTAWDASAAAAGSMMLFARARADMEAQLRPPQIR